MPPPVRRPRPFRAALLSGLGVLLPPLLTIVILVWIWQTVRFYVLEPITAETRDLLAVALADVHDDLPGAKPTEEPGVVSFDGRLYRQLPNGQYIPLSVYTTVLKGVGDAAPPATGQEFYRRYVELTYLKPVIVVPVFLVVFVSVMYVLGSLFAAGIGSVFWENFEYGITHLPVVRSVYGAAKQVTDYMFSMPDERGLEFKRVVAFEHPSRGIWQIGFVAGEGLREVRDLAGEPLLTVLVHVNPVPVSGYVRLVPRSQAIDLDMTIDQAVHYIVSFGVVLPPQQLPVRIPEFAHAQRPWSRARGLRTAVSFRTTQFLRMSKSGSPTPAVDDATIAREAVLLAPYALHSSDSAGRKHPEPPHPYRALFARDRDRIVHSSAYRRLSYKTQVFTGELGDYHRSRLTHTLEATSIARTLGRALRLNEDLVEALMLAHDIGHPPFGHAGEETLDACLQASGGFSHNRQALRIVESLEHRYAAFPGLNLSYEVLEGQAARIDKGSGSQRPLLEAQVVDAADSIAYDTHDADDAMEIGLLSLDELLETPLWREAAARVRVRHAALEAAELRRAVLHELIDWQVGELLAQTQLRLKAETIDSVAAARNSPLIVAHSTEISAMKRELEHLLHGRVYRHPQVLRMRLHAQQQLKEMFAGYSQRPELLPEGFQRRVPAAGLPRTVGDYIAGMTDRFALREHARLFAQE